MSQNSVRIELVCKDCGVNVGFLFVPVNAEGRPVLPEAVRIPPCNICTTMASVQSRFEPLATRGATP